MSFTTVFFIFVFLPISIGLFFAIRYFSEKLSKIYVILLSMFFYSWALFDNVFMLLGIILITYILGILVHGVYHRDRYVKKNKGKFFFLVLAIPVLIFGFYKYFSFMVLISNRFLGTGLFVSTIVAPLGISYIVLSMISYIVDIRRGDAEPTGILDTALFISFFPKIVSGPITKYKDFCNSKIESVLSVANLTSGISRFIIGLGKKLILADFLSEVVNTIPIWNIDIPTIFLSIFLYGLQIYLDFEAYTDIAIGLAMIFGYSLPENFNYPYLSSSISEFWKRWHITLGSFLKDYLYIPLGGSRVGKFRHLINLVFSFVVLGLFSGAGFRYLIWAIIHGFFVIFEKLVENIRVCKKIPVLIKRFFAMSIVFISWQLWRLSFDGFISLLSGVFEDYESMPFTWNFYVDLKLIVITAIATLYSFGISKKIRISIEKKLSDNLYENLKYIALVLLFLISVFLIIVKTYSPVVFQY